MFIKKLLPNRLKWTWVICNVQKKFCVNCPQKLDINDKICLKCLEEDYKRNFQ